MGRAANAPGTGKAFGVSAATSESRGFVEVKRRALVHEIPLIVHLELTYDCDYRCLFCYNPKERRGSILSMQEWDTVLKDLRELGALTVTLTGGDSLAHPEF
jgi:MoaA/NifB/PqqE/SkfB family radical SAM enzyme